MANANIGARIIRGLFPDKAEFIFNFVNDMTPSAIEVAEHRSYDDSVDADVMLILTNFDIDTRRHEVVNGDLNEDEDTGDDGDGSETAFSGDFDNGPVLPFTCEVKATVGGVEMVLEDHGDGKLYERFNGALGYTLPLTMQEPVGTVDYFGATWEATFPSAPDNATDILVTYRQGEETTLKGAFVVAPTEGSLILPPLPYWGALTLYGLASVNRLVRMDIELQKMRNVQTP